MKEFALIGAAGFVAPRHLKAITDVKGSLIAALDLSDSVGVLDQYFPEALFFTEPERFDRYLERRRREEGPLDYVSICSPNHLHDAHVRMALRCHCHAICEKPLVISPWNLDALSRLEEEFDKRVYTVQQLRQLPQLIELRREVRSSFSHRRRVVLEYVTRRGPWYHQSWKGDRARSGGLAANIGIHFFDVLLWIFGKVRSFELLESSAATMRGTLELEAADVVWTLSIDSRLLPSSLRERGGYAFRTLCVDGREIDLSGEFSALHSRVYEDIVAGNGCGIEAARPSIELAHRLASSKPRRSPTPATM